MYKPAKVRPCVENYRGLVKAQKYIQRISVCNYTANDGVVEFSRLQMMYQSAEAG
jgi:hypothetical protein